MRLLKRQLRQCRAGARTRRRTRQPEPCASATVSMGSSGSALQSRAEVEAAHAKTTEQPSAEDALRAEEAQSCVLSISPLRVDTMGGKPDVAGKRSVHGQWHATAPRLTRSPPYPQTTRPASACARPCKLYVFAHCNAPGRASRLCQVRRQALAQHHSRRPGDGRGRVRALPCCGTRSGSHGRC